AGAGLVSEPSAVAPAAATAADRTRNSRRPRVLSNMAARPACHTESPRRVFLVGSAVRTDRPAAPRDRSAQRTLPRLSDMAARPACQRVGESPLIASAL